MMIFEDKKFYSEMNKKVKSVLSQNEGARNRGGMSKVQNNSNWIAGVRYTLKVLKSHSKKD